jgi:DNA polymerase elongation subunit (family B)
MPGIGVDRAIEYGKKLDESIKNDLFAYLGGALVMEYEKTYSPFLQVCQKKYAGMKYESDPTVGQLSASGLSLVKRDSAMMCKRTMTTFFEYLLVQKDKNKALDSIRVVMADLYANQLPLEDFCITKKISKRPDAYKTVPPHILSWQRMVERVGTTAAPVVGERFEYIFTNFGKKDKMSDHIVDTDLVREQGFSRFNVAKDHYYSLAIDKPMRIIMELIYGKRTTDDALNPQNYENVETITAKAGNILGFFGKDKITNKRRWYGMGVDDKVVTEIRQTRITCFKGEDEGEDEGGEDE